MLMALEEKKKARQHLRRANIALLEVVTYRMGPPEGVVIKAYALAGSSPGRPGVFDRDAGQNRGDHRRHHEQDTVNDGHPTKDTKLL